MRGYDGKDLIDIGLAVVSTVGVVALMITFLEALT